MNPYFAHLYQVSTSGAGVLSQGDFVSFLKKSGLGKQDLSAAWKCCLITGPEVSREEFCVAMAAVGVLQASPNSPVTREYVMSLMSGGGALPVPAFEGVPRPSPPPPASTGGPSFSISPEDQEKYNRIFASTDTDGDGYVMGGEAVALFTKSGLEKGVLKSIWSLSDLDKDNRLDHPEFCVAMHLVVSLSKRGMQLPTTLPPELVPAAKAHLVAPSSGGAAAAAQPPPLAAPPAQSFKAMSLDDAFSSASIDIGLPIPTPAAQPEPTPTPVPVTVEAPIPPPSIAAPVPPPSSYSPEPPSSTHGFAPVVPSLQSNPAAAAGGASFSAPSYSVTQQPSHANAGSGSGGSGGTPPHPTVAAVAGDLEAAMSSQVKRENGLLDAKRDMVSGAAGDLKRLEQERNVFLGQVERLKAACAEEDGEYAGIVGKIEAVRKEIAGLRGVELKSSAAYEERVTRKVEAKGVLATLVATLVAEGGRAEELEGELRALVEKALGQELGAARLATGAAQLQGVAQQHGTAAEGAEEGAAALRLALAASQARVRALEGERGALEAKLVSAGVNFEAATQTLVQAERALDSAKARHLESIKAKMEALVASSHAQGRVSALEEATASLRELGGEVTRGVPRTAAAPRPAPTPPTASPPSFSSFSTSSPPSSLDTSPSFTSSASAAPPPPRQEPAPVAPAIPAPAPAPVLPPVEPVAAPPSPPTPPAPTPAPVPTPPAPTPTTSISSAFDDDDLFNMASSSSTPTAPSLDVAPTPALPPPAPSDAFGFDDAAFPDSLPSNPTPASSGGMGGGGEDGDPFGSAFDAEFDTKAAVAASTTGEDDWPVDTKPKEAPPAEDAFTW